MQRASEWFRAAAELVGRLTTRWAKAGALAAADYRLADRPTTDADILIEWREDLVGLLESDGYAVRVIRDPAGDHPHLLIARRGDARIDFMIPTEPYQELALDRARDNVLTVEDVIIHKLIAWRPRDRDDIASILAAGHTFDRAYIEHWAREWEVSDHWVEATRAR